MSYSQLPVDRGTDYSQLLFRVASAYLMCRSYYRNLQSHLLVFKLRIVIIGSLSVDELMIGF